MKKVLVGCPVSYHKEYCFKEYFDGIKSLTYPNHDVLLVDNSEDDNYFNKIKKFLPAIKGPYFESALDRIITSRNVLREKVIEGNYDYFLSLEQDVIPPKDIIERLLKHNKKVITGIYFVHNKIGGKIKLTPLAYKEIPSDKELPDMRPLRDSELMSNDLIKIVSCGLGCVLIHRDVLKKIKFRHENKVFDDRFFCIDLYKQKIPIYADTSIKCKHYIYNRPYPWSKIKK